MKKVQTVIPFAKVNDSKLKRNFLEAKKDPVFKKIVESSKIPENILMKHTSQIEEVSQEYSNCSTCKNLLECKNKQKGLFLMINSNLKDISFGYKACKYFEKFNKDNEYKKYVYLYEIPKDISSAAIKDIYRNDSSRLPVIKVMKKFIDNYFQDNHLKGIYLSGNFGTGKTYILSALFNELAKKKVKSAIIYFPEFLRNLKSSFTTDYEEQMLAIKRVSLLLIDDIGAENLTSWSRDEVLGPILQYRMQEKLPTFFTSNLNLSQLEEHLSMTGATVDKVKARRIIERIKYLANDIEMVGQNRRETKNEN